jgi:hypothetical protein
MRRGTRRDRSSYNDTPHQYEAPLVRASRPGQVGERVDRNIAVVADRIIEHAVADIIARGDLDAVVIIGTCGPTWSQCTRGSLQPCLQGLLPKIG